MSNSTVYIQPPRSIGPAFAARTAAERCDVSMMASERQCALALVPRGPQLELVAAARRPSPPVQQVIDFDAFDSEDFAYPALRPVPEAKPALDLPARDLGAQTPRPVVGGSARTQGTPPVAEVKALKPSASGPRSNSGKVERVSALARARSVADELLADVSWTDSRAFDLLVEVFENSGNMLLSRNRILELIHDGMSVDEFAFSVAIRRSWCEHVPFDVVRAGNNAWEYRHGPATVPTWESCLRMVRCFSWHIDETDFLELIERLHDRWTARRMRHGDDSDVSFSFKNYCCALLRNIDHAGAFVAPSIDMLVGEAP